MSIATIHGWFAQLCSGEPHQVIGPPADPYLMRWFLVPRNAFINVYLHTFCSSDPSAPHDHPWQCVGPGPWRSVARGRVTVSSCSATR